MSALLYFLPRVESSSLVTKDGRWNVGAVRAAGIEHVVRGIKRPHDGCSIAELRGTGPGGFSGTIVCAQPPDGSLPARLGYYPERQTWHESPAGISAWLGVDIDQPPTPLDLARAGKLPLGNPVELGDGNTWQVPILRSPFSRDEPGRSVLPFDFVYDRAGRLEKKLAAEHADLWEMSAMAWDHFFAQHNQPTLDYDFLVDLAIRTLSLAYRVGKPEQTVLHLIRSTNWEETLKALLDWPLVAELLAEDDPAQKKSGADPAADLSSVSPGAQEETPATDPAAAA